MQRVKRGYRARESSRFLFRLSLRITPYSPLSHAFGHTFGHTLPPLRLRCRSLTAMLFSFRKRGKKARERESPWPGYLYPFLLAAGFSLSLSVSSSCSL